MEELLTQLSEVLGMSVDGVVEYYPVLKQQYAAYYVLTSTRRALGMLLTLTPFIMLLTMMAVLALDDFKVRTVSESVSFLQSKSKYFLAVFVLVVLVYFAAKIGVGVLATDILMIKEFL